MCKTVLSRAILATELPRPVVLSGAIRESRHRHRAGVQVDIDGDACERCGERTSPALYWDQSVANRPIDHREDGMV